MNRTGVNGYRLLNIAYIKHSLHPRGERSHLQKQTIHRSGDSDHKDNGRQLQGFIREVFGKVRECLDVYHGLEHVSDTGKVLYGEGTVAYNPLVPVPRRETHRG